jgi:hypothetical protein
MHFFIPCLLLVLGVAFGAWAWRRGTWYVTRLPGLHVERPIGTSHTDWEKTLSRRYRRRRVLMTFVGAVGAPAVAFAALMLFAVVRR